MTVRDQPQTEGLRSGAVRTHHLVFFVLSAAAPLTCMAGFAPLAFLLGGQAAPVGYLLAGIVCAVFAVGFTAISRHVRSAGAFYAYITRGLGGVVGSGSAVMAYVGYTFGEIGFCAAAGLFASVLLDVAGINISWGVCAVVLGLLVSIVAYCRVDLGARVLAVLLLAEVGVLAILSAAILWRGAPEGLSLQGFNPSTWDAASLGSLFVVTFVVYIGFEQTAVYSEEAHDPRKTVPRATYLAVGVLAVIYTFFSWMLLMAIGPSGLGDALSGDPSTLVFGISQDFLGTAMTDLMRILIVTSFFAGVLAMHNAGARYLFALGREGLLPGVLSRTSPTSQSPNVAVLVQATIVLVALAGFAVSSLDPYTQVVIWMSTPTVIGVLVLQILTSLSIIVFFRSRPEGEDVWHRLVAPVLSIVLLSAVLYLIVTKMYLLTGLGPLGNLLLVVPVALSFVVGAVRGEILRRRDPAAFQRLGRADVEVA